MRDNRESTGGVGAENMQNNSISIHSVVQYFSNLLLRNNLRKNLTPKEKEEMRQQFIDNRNTYKGVFGPNGKPLENNKGQPIYMSGKEEFWNTFLGKYNIPQDAFSATFFFSIISNHVYECQLGQLEKGQEWTPSLNIEGMLSKLGLKSIESFPTTEYYGFYDQFLQKYTISLNGLDEYQQMLLKKAIDDAKTANPLLTKEQFFEKLIFPINGGYVKQILDGQKTLEKVNNVVDSKIPSYEIYSGQTLKFDHLENMCNALVQEGFLQPYDGIECLDSISRIQTQGFKTIQSSYLTSLLHGLVKEGFLKK